MRVVCIIQSRVGSTRLPRKALADIEGVSMLAHVRRRARRIRGVHDVVVATPDAAPDLAEDDVLSRFVVVAVQFDADIIVRLTGDCPLLDPEESSAVLANLGTNDYITNRRQDTDGLDTEAFTLIALMRAHRAATSHYDREHVTPYMYRHPDEFKCAEYRGRSIPNGEKWSVDTAADLELVRRRMREELARTSTSAHII